jgi:hypothetical protein
MGAVVTPMTVTMVTMADGQGAVHQDRLRTTGTAEMDDDLGVEVRPDHLAAAVTVRAGEAAGETQEMISLIEP